MLHGKLMGTNSQQATNLFNRGYSTSRASLLRGYCFQFGNQVGSWFSLVGSSRSPPVPQLGVNFVLPQFLVPSYWRGCSGFLSSNQKLQGSGAEKLPITRVVTSLVSISLPNKGVGPSGNTRNWWENICPSQQQRHAWVNLFVIVFFFFFLQHTKWHRFRRRSLQSRSKRSVQSKQPLCQPRNSQTYLAYAVSPLAPVPWLEWAVSILLNHPEGRLDA